MIAAALSLMAPAGLRAEPEAAAEEASLSENADQGWGETGIASWYGKELHGKRSSSGETFDMDAMTAAHKTLPFGTWVQVRNPANGLSVKVRVIDRGPFPAGRVIDLSRAAAAKLGLLRKGVGRVKLSLVPPGPGDAAPGGSR